MQICRPMYLRICYINLHNVFYVQVFLTLHIRGCYKLGHNQPIAVRTVNTVGYVGREWLWLTRDNRLSKTSSNCRRSPLRKIVGSSRWRKYEIKTKIVTWFFTGVTKFPCFRQSISFGGVIPDMTCPKLVALQFCAAIKYCEENSSNDRCENLFNSTKSK